MTPPTNSLPTQRRVNLARSLLYAGAMSAFIYFISNLSKSDEKRFSYFYSELMLGYAAEDWMKNPVPVLGTTLNLMQIGMGQKNFSTILNWTGPVSLVRRVKGLYKP